MPRTTASIVPQSAPVTQLHPLSSAAPQSTFEAGLRTTFAWAFALFGSVSAYFGVRLLILVESSKEPSLAAAAVAIRFHAPQPLLVAYVAGGLILCASCAIYISRAQRGSLVAPATMLALLFGLSVFTIEKMIPEVDLPEFPERIAPAAPSAGLIGSWVSTYDPGTKLTFHDDGTGVRSGPDGASLIEWAMNGDELSSWDKASPDTVYTVVWTMDKEFAYVNGERAWRRLP